MIIPKNDTIDIALLFDVIKKQKSPAPMITESDKNLLKYLALRAVNHFLFIDHDGNDSSRFDIKRKIGTKIKNKNILMNNNIFSPPIFLFK